MSDRDLTLYLDDAEADWPAFALEADSGHSRPESQQRWPRPQPEPKGICIVGLGYVGLTLAVALANAGCRVHGVERAARIRAAVAAGRAHFAEAGLDSEIARHAAGQRLTAGDALPPAEAVDTYIITVGTPLTQDGAVDLASLEEVLQSVARVLKHGDLVILRSTVKAGTTRRIAQPILAATGVDFDLAFCPERTLEGQALSELTTLPQIVGGATPRAARRAARIFARLSPRIIVVDSLEAAEMVKLINNTQRDLMFAFANEVAEMCDAAGVSAMKVIQAACADYPRSSIPRPGPVGGPCLEKDPHILAEGLREVDYVPRVSLAGRRLNEELPRSTIARIGKRLSLMGFDGVASPKICILGLAFKGQPETDDLRGTMAAPILGAARARWPRARYYGFDPVVPEHAFESFDLTWCATLEEAFQDASLILVQNNHSVFQKMPIARLAGYMADPALIYDYWNLFDAAALRMPAGRIYGGLGALPLEVTTP